MARAHTDSADLGCAYSGILMISPGQSRWLWLTPRGGTRARAWRRLLVARRPHGRFRVAWAAGMAGPGALGDACIVLACAVGFRTYVGEQADRRGSQAPASQA